MKKVILFVLLVSVIQLSASAQTSAEKIIGWWGQQNTDDKRASWTFNEGGSGNIEVKRLTGKRRCSSNISFTWELSGNTLKLSTGDQSLSCTLMGSEDNSVPESTKDLGKSYINKSESYKISLDDPKKLILGNFVLTRE